MNTPPTAGEFADRIFTAALGTMETFNLYLGERLGWLDALAEAAATPAELADRTRTNMRYAVEWLEAQAVYGNLTVVDDGAGDRLQRRYAMPSGAAEVLTDRQSLNYLGALPQMMAAAGACVRSNRGVLAPLIRCCARAISSTSAAATRPSRRPRRSGSSSSAPRTGVPQRSSRPSIRPR